VKIRRQKLFLHGNGLEECVAKHAIRLRCAVKRFDSFIEPLRLDQLAPYRGFKNCRDSPDCNAREKRVICYKVDRKPAGKESEAKVPTDLGKALAVAPKAKAQWKDLTPIGRRDFVSWLDSAKQPETRRRRVERACSMLASGKRRPCCYSIVSFNLYKALAAIPKAKAQWSDLTSIERRDFISWMDSAKQQPEVHKRRIEKACLLLAAGKRRP
jgi:uncharacterized protein YdeI (YjbR/CyaY-like superfamily)